MQTNNHIEKEVEKKYKRRDNKKNKKMKVSGKKILELKKIISDKG